MKEQNAAHSSPISERYETNDDVRLNILINHLERVAAEWPYSNRIFQDREAALRAMKSYAEHELTRLRSELQQKDEYKNLLESVLRLKHIITYEENIPPEHHNEAIAINNLFYKIEHALACDGKNERFCQCLPEEKHGSTTAWHCNNCGKLEQTEIWLK